MARKLPPAVQEYFDKVFEPHDTRPDLGDDWLGKMVTAMDDVSTLQIARRLLKERGARRFSAPNWEDLKTERLEPAIEDKELKRADIRAMVEDMEEHSKAHVFLFKAKSAGKVAKLLQRSRVTAALTKLGLSNVMDAVPPPDTPVKMAVVHVRFEQDGSLIVKALETKEAFRSVEDIELTGGREVRLAQRTRVRRVKLARLHPHGLLEVRLGSTRVDPAERNDHKYSAEADSFLRFISSLIPPGDFEPAPLDKFKANLWKRSRKKQEDRILVLGQNMATDEGNVMALRAGSRAKDASQDQTLKIASQAFLGQKGSSMAQAKILWLAQPDPDVPQIDITIRVTDEIHEFYTTRATCKADYERVLSDIRRLGKL